MLTRSSTIPHVVDVHQPLRPDGAVEVSHDRRTAFATINYDKRANLLPTTPARRCSTAINAVHVPGLQIAAGGQVIENAEGFNIGPGNRRSAWSRRS